MRSVDGVHRGACDRAGSIGREARAAGWSIPSSQSVAWRSVSVAVRPSRRPHSPAVERKPLQAGSIDHIGVGVADLLAAKQYYDEFMPIVGFTAWFPADDDQFNYGPDGAVGTQIFFYRSLEPTGFSRHGIGLQHLAFTAPDRAVVDQAHGWATARDATVVHAPRSFPEYGDHCYATFFLDPHGIMLEVVCHVAPTDLS